MPAVLLATCSALPDGDAEERLLIPALRKLGVDARWAVWDDPAVDWSSGLTVLRSTWDYTLRRAEFLAWTETVPALRNSAEVVRWNSDKVYLHDLAAAGVPVTPTEVVAPGGPTVFPEVEFVVKPSVGAGSRGAGRFRPGESAVAAAHLAELHAAGRTALVQPYLSEVDEAGETALVFLAGGFSHAVRKGPMLAGSTVYGIDESRGLFIEENIEARTASAREIALGERAIAFLADRFGAAPLYARVDLLPSRAGPVVVELELTEPSLFLSHDEAAPSRLADAILAAL